jgi:nucleoside-diphosphate-sugar epimerase
MNAENNFNDKQVIITGGLGFIGSCLARKLVALNAKVTLVDSLIPEYGGNLFNIAGIEKQVNVNISDVRDEHSMRYLIQEKDYLFNLAGQTSHLDSMYDPFTDLDINSKAQLSILEVCRKYNPSLKVVFASTRQIYGRPTYLPVDEKHLLQPVDVNGVNKMAGEWFHILYNNVYDIRSCALRLTNIFGPRMRIKDAKQTFLGVWIRLLIEGKPFEVWGGQQLRDFVYIDDAVDAFLSAAANEKANGRIFNLGNDEILSLKELAELLAEIETGCKYEVCIFPENRKKIDIGDYYTDYSLIQSTLGWAPKVSIKKGLKKTVQYYSKHLEHYI